MAEPPFEGVAQETDVIPCWKEPATLVGALGTVIGVTETEGIEAALTPAPFVAVTANV